MNKEKLDFILSSSFLYCSKSDPFLLDFDYSKFVFNESIDKMHPERIFEYKSSRALLSTLLLNEYKIEHYNYLTDQKFVKLPSGLLGSISHTKDAIIVAIAQNKKYLGIDIEQTNRIKKSIDSHIKTQFDILEVNGLTENELSTLIFSAKESLYKALFPIVNKFFGFDYAALTSVDLNQNVFTIELLKALSEDYSPASFFKFHGRFYLDNEYIITIID